MSDSDSTVCQLEIIAALCTEAPNTAIRDCLRKYDPKKPGWQIENVIKNEKKAVLVDTLEFLGVPGMAEFKASSLPHELICRIQNLFLDTCDLCKQTYCIKLHDKPIVSCVRCGQGCHNQCVLQLLGKTEDDLDDTNMNGAALLKPHAGVSLFYVCSPCQQEVIPQKDNLKVKKQARRDTPPNSNPITSPSGAGDQTEPVLSQSTREEIATQPNTDVDGSRDARLERDESSQDEVVIPSCTTNINNAEPPTDPPICKFYKQGRCKHGISGKKDGDCSFSHPKPCQRLLANGANGPRGCTKGASCTLFHPQMCHRSLREKICLRTECKFMHVRGTRRSDP